MSYTKEESDSKYPDKSSVAYLTHVRHQDFQGSIGVKTQLSVRGTDDVAGLTLKPGIDKSLALRHNNKWNYYSFPDQSGTVALASDVEGVDNYPVGAPIPWPSATPPSGYLICNGQVFQRTTYPKLAEAYPSGKLPDLRGNFFVVWITGVALIRTGKYSPYKKVRRLFPPFVVQEEAPGGTAGKLN